MLLPELSAVFCQMWLHHQPFVCAQVPPTDSSVMRRQHEGRGLSVKMTGTSIVDLRGCFEEQSSFYINQKQLCFYMYFLGLWYLTAPYAHSGLTTNHPKSKYTL